MHIAKYKKQAIGHLFAHYERSSNPSNKSIDVSRTALNYNLAPEGNQLDRLHSRLSEIKIPNRKDINVICDCVVTAPKDLTTEQQPHFFNAAYMFLSERYGGEKNVISAYVHMDETQPHMHFCFTPIVKDKKQVAKEKLCAKEAVNRQDLMTLHSDFQHYLDLHKIKCSVITNETKTKGNLSIVELKNEKLQKENQSLRQDNRELIKKYNLLAVEYNGLVDAAHDVESLQRQRIDRERGER